MKIKYEYLDRKGHALKTKCPNGVDCMVNSKICSYCKGFIHSDDELQIVYCDIEKKMTTDKLKKLFTEKTGMNPIDNQGQYNKMYVEILEKFIDENVTDTIEKAIKREEAKRIVTINSKDKQK